MGIGANYEVINIFKQSESARGFLVKATYSRTVYSSSYGGMTKKLLGQGGYPVTPFGFSRKAIRHLFFWQCPTGTLNGFGNYSFHILKEHPPPEGQKAATFYNISNCLVNWSLPMFCNRSIVYLEP